MTSMHDALIRQWLAALAIRCEPRSKENLEVLIADYAKVLGHYPPEVWCDAARLYVSHQTDRFPSFRALCKALDEWAKKNVAQVSRLPTVDDPNLSDLDKAAVRSWINLRSEGDLTVRLDLIRNRSDAAFRYILRTDDEALTIARRRGWFSEDDRPLDVSESGIAANLIKLERLSKEGRTQLVLAQLGLSLLRRAVANNAPDRLTLLPDAIVPPRVDPRTVEEQIAAVTMAHHGINPATGRVYGSLSPEQLAAMRQQGNYGKTS